MRSEYASRNTGDFGLSIGTATALVSFINRSKKEKLDRLLINIATLVRNMFDSMDKPYHKAFDLSGALFTMGEEMITIRNVIREQLGVATSVIFYYQDLDALQWRYPNAKWKRPRTEQQTIRQQRQTLLLERMITSLVDKAKPIPQTVPQRYQGEVEFVRVEAEMPSFEQEVVVCLTHQPIQLLRRFFYKRLYLLESHTGNFKGYDAFSTKLTGLSEGDNIPFNAFTVQLFGDGTCFDSFPTSLKREIRSIANNQKWTVATSDQKVYKDIEQSGSLSLKNVFSTLMRRVKL